jgi:hypothetical protein
MTGSDAGLSRPLIQINATADVFLTVAAGNGPDAVQIQNSKE